MTDGKPDFSNVVAGSSSTAEAPATGQAVPAAPPRIYVVQKGDSLSKIATTFYGSPKGWRRIFEANRDRIKDPDLIQPGWKLAIPPGEGVENSDKNVDKDGVA